MADSVSDTFSMQPVFVDGLHHIDVDRYGLARLTLFAEQRDSYDGSKIERVVVARLIIPGGVLADIAARMLGASRAPEAMCSVERPRVTN